MKIATIVGARPQFIKAAVVSGALQKERPEAREVLIHTGQHFDANMSGVFFEELELTTPDYNLAIGGGTHGQNTGRMVEKIEEVLLREKPDRVLVYGDTDSTLAGALAAVKLHIPVAHVEAGLRSFNRRMPEEINRVLTDHAADLLFTPTDTATRNLASEGVEGEAVRQVGDVMYDAALYYGERAEQTSRILDKLDLRPKRYVLITLHRAENTDDRDRMRNILAGLAMSGQPIVWPLHPRTSECLKRFGLQLPANVRPIDPVGYLDMTMLERQAAAIGTDSGGVQKEAYFHRVPCVTFREETEWVELVDLGVNKLVGSCSRNISAELAEAPDIWPQNANLYGGGDAASRIAEQISSLPDLI